MNSIDEFLDAVKEQLTHPDSGVAELTAANVIVWHHGLSDPDEDIKTAVGKCQGVSVLVYDQGGDADPEDAASPVIISQLAIELFLDPSKRNRRKSPSLRTAGSIRDDIMRCLHLSAILLDASHCHMESHIKGYKPLADPDYVAYRIRLDRPIAL